MRRTPFSCSRVHRKAAVVSLIESSSAVVCAALVGRRVVLRGAAGAGHRDALGLDDVGRLRRPVRVVLEPAARIAGARERSRIALLLVGPMLLLLAPAPEHRTPIPAASQLNRWRFATLRPS